MRFSHNFLVVVFIFVSGAGLHSQERLLWRTDLWRDTFERFDSSRYYLGSNTSHISASQWLQITPSVASQSGRIYFLKPFHSQFFDASFRFFIPRPVSGNEGADGIVFAFAPIYDYPGAGGGAMDFDGCLGYGVEFDTYYDPFANDPSVEHIAIIKNDVRTHLGSYVVSNNTLKSGSWHSVNIRNDNGFVQVVMDGVTYIQFAIPNFLLFDAYFGLTSATGSAYSMHLIDDVLVTVPTRTSWDFGLFNSCIPLSKDTTLRVINNSGKNLTITNAALTDVTGTNDFSLIQPFIQTNLAPNDSARIDVRFNPQSPGVKKALLTLTSSNGEIVHDTLIARVDNPSITFQNTSVTFSSTHVGRVKDTLIVVQNMKTFPFIADSISITGKHASSFIVLQPQTPFTVAPQSQRTILLRFIPQSDSLQSATVQIHNSCVPPSTISLSGIGEIKTLRVRIDTSMVIRPLQTASVIMELLDAPAPGFFTAFDCTIDFNFRMLDFIGIDQTSTVCSAYRIMYTKIGGGAVQIIARGDTVTQAGTLLKLLFTSTKNDTGCSTMRITNFAFLASPTLYNIPRSATQGGRLCVNPSCRIPEGLKRVPVRAVQNVRITPNPPSSAIGSTAHVSLDLLEEVDAIAIMLYDQFGRTLRAINERGWNKGTHSVTFRTSGFVSGMHWCVISVGKECVVQPLLILP